MAYIAIIGAGIGGLTAAALLLKRGHRVTVLEASTYPGGCAGTFFHQGYRFDTGATLAGGFDDNGPHTRLAHLLGLEWQVSPIQDAAWAVHLPGRTIHQWVCPDRWHNEYLTNFPYSEAFWHKQEQLAKISWDLSARDFPFPPATLKEALRLPLGLRPATLSAAPYLHRKLRGLLPRQTDADFKAFIDAQLLISAQAVSDDAGALYGSTVLDLPRRGVVHVHGGMGGIAETLVQWIRTNGGEVKYRQQVLKLETRHGRVVAAHTNKGLRIEADAFLGNVTPWALERLLGEAAPTRLRVEVKRRAPMWGAFIVYAGLDAGIVNQSITHHQVVMDVNQRLGEGNSVFISLSPLQDASRAPQGMRTATLSTHTRVLDWDRLHRESPQDYAERKAEYTERLLNAAECALPGFRNAATLILPGTPHTFETFTRRPLGMVGGFPQTSLLRTRSPKTGLKNLWLVGDSIFPGQSTAGVTLGAMRVAQLVQDQMRNLHVN
ncbi:MAG TPA: NAD(P)/FAD-dependent oxidoreductase [Anaerolineales bacterium]|nr:NAD(P)/FAD-dependent oxidoreductase [Anaerolineales bacterium]